jgi:hypothetical protein
VLSSWPVLCLFNFDGCFMFIVFAELPHIQPRIHARQPARHQPLLPLPWAPPSGLPCQQGRARTRARGARAWAPAGGPAPPVPPQNHLWQAVGQVLAPHLCGQFAHEWRRRQRRRSVESKVTGGRTSAQKSRTSGNWRKGSFTLLYSPHFNLFGSLAY